MQVTVTPALAERFRTCVVADDVEGAILALREAWTKAFTVEKIGHGCYRDVPDHRTRAWAAREFLRIVGLVAPTQLRVSGQVGIVTATMDELVSRARTVERLARASEIVAGYVEAPKTGLSLEAPEVDELVEVDA